MKNNYSKYLLALIVIAFVIPQLVLAVWWNPFSWSVWKRIYYFFQPLVVQQVVCTQEAKLCPDGSSVSRTGPNCEFAACPQVPDETADWKTYTNDEYGFEFKYPQNWLIKSVNKNVSVWSAEDKKMSVNYSDIDSYKNFVKELTGKDFVSIKEFFKGYYGNVGEINLAGRQAYVSVVSAFANDYLIAVEFNNGVYILSTRYNGEFPPDLKNPKIDASAKKIISTFKFTK